MKQLANIEVKQKVFYDYYESWLSIHKAALLRSSSYDVCENTLQTHIYPILGDSQIGVILLIYRI